MSSFPIKSVLLAVAVLAGAGALGAPFILDSIGHGAKAEAPAQVAPQATPVSVARVEQRFVSPWDEFSGRLEAVERVEIRSRVAGAIQAVHFREGALVKKGDLLVTIDPAPFAAAVERAQAQVRAAQANVVLTRRAQDRAQSLSTTGNISNRDLDQRVNAYREASATLAGAEAALKAARLDLGYTTIEAPVSGRVGRREITVGNLVSAGPQAPALTTLVSVDPIYAGFEADEQIVTRALSLLPQGKDARAEIGLIPVQMGTAADTGTPLTGRLQLVDNAVDPRSGTVRVRAVFDNPDGRLMPGQFVRIRMGRPVAEPALLITERAVGTDQDKKYVMVVDGDNKATYREVTLGPTAAGLRIVTSGLKEGERIVVNGLHRIRPGALIAPQAVSMENGGA